jgi:hypothetical protein
MVAYGDSDYEAVSFLYVTLLSKKYFSLLSLLKKINLGLCDHHAIYVSVHPHPPSTFECLNPSL